MPLSGVPIISLRTLVAFCNWLSAAKAGAQNVRNRKTTVSLFIWSLLILYLHLQGCVSHAPVTTLEVSVRASSAVALRANSPVEPKDTATRIGGSYGNLLRSD